MNDDNNMEDRVARLERAEASRGQAISGSRLVGFVMILVFSALTYWQFGLINESVARRERNDKEHQFWFLCHSTATPELRTASFLSLVDAGNTEWRSARLDRLKLSGANLRETDLRWGAFEASNFSESNLTGAILDNADLRLVDLSDANLSDASLNNINLVKADLDNATLRSASLQGSLLGRASFFQAELVLADLSDSDLAMADLTEANLTGCQLVGASLDAAILKGANLGLANLAGAVLTDVDLTNSSWWRARGLTTEQIRDFRERFAPTDEADDARRNDYRLWLQSVSGASQ